jgi:hypothetical protein
VHALEGVEALLVVAHLYKRVQHELAQALEDLLVYCSGARPVTSDHRTFNHIGIQMSGQRPFRSVEWNSNHVCDMNESPKTRSFKPVLSAMGVEWSGTPGGSSSREW